MQVKPSISAPMTTTGILSFEILSYMYCCTNGLSIASAMSIIPSSLGEATSSYILFSTSVLAKYLLKLYILEKTAVCAPSFSACESIPPRTRCCSGSETFADIIPMRGCSFIAVPPFIFSAILQLQHSEVYQILRGRYFRGVFCVLLPMTIFFRCREMHLFHGRL